MMTRSLAGAVLALVVVLAGGPVLADFPTLSGRVVDAAGLLDGATEARLSEQLRLHEEASSHQVVVATIPSLEGRSIEEYGVDLGRAWGIGQEGRDNGAILLVAPEERQVRIEVGYGLEGELTDLRSHQIIQEAILPEFRRGNFAAGISAGVREILFTLEGGVSPAPQSEAYADEGDGFALPHIMFLLFFGFSLVSLLMSRHRRIGSGRRHYGGWGGRGGRSSGGGGFSGGGGSFGGGGSSGGW